MTCCRCNRTGSCKNCSCSKSNLKCTNCLPSRLNKCLNLNLNSDGSEERSLSEQEDQTDLEAITTIQESCLSNTDNAQTLSQFDSSFMSELESPVNNDRASCVQSTTTEPLSSSGNGEWKLPDPSPVAEPTFTWGELDSVTFIAHVNKAYDEVVHWNINLFSVPFGSTGKSFVLELARLYRAFATASALECIALKAAMVLTVLALQKPYSRSKAKMNAMCLQRRMESWSKGLVVDLLAEGVTIQKRTFKGSRI